VPFATLEPMMRITLNAMLRAVFGAEGKEFDQLRDLIPPLVKLGSRLVAVLTLPRIELGPLSPWKRYAAYRRRFDDIVDSLIAQAKADPALESRDDVLALMLRARYDDGEAMADRDIADQLLTILTAGHETTATTLSWTFERLSRHPEILARLVREGDEGGSELRRATILEVQRNRPVIDLTARRVKAETFELGDWVFPRGFTVMVGIGLVHTDDAVFPDAATFDPDRFVGVNPDLYSWVPYGGGTRRCIGAAFADMEMNVVLRTLLREFDFDVTDAASERFKWRGVAFAPGRGGRVVAHRRQAVAHGSEKLTEAVSA
jgi:cytochrome P450